MRNPVHLLDFFLVVLREVNNVVIELVLGVIEDINQRSDAVLVRHCRDGPKFYPIESQSLRSRYYAVIE